MHDGWQNSWAFRFTFTAVDSNDLLIKEKGDITGLALSSPQRKDASKYYSTVSSELLIKRLRKLETIEILSL